MGIIMNKLNFFVGMAVSISGLFAGSKVFATSGSVTSACDPSVAAAACNPGCITVVCGSTDPLAACNASPASCAPNCDAGCLSAAACGEGVGAVAPCGACNACGGTGFYSIAKNHWCGILGLGLTGYNDCGSYACGKQCNLNAPNVGCLSPKLRNSLFEGTKLSGYANAGYLSNFAGDRSNGYTDFWSETTPACNTLYIAATKKAVTNGCGFDIGYSIDFMFGEDYRILRSVRGLDQDWYTGHMSDGRLSYGFAMPQAYLEVVINNWSVKMGHFYGLVAYEGGIANARFFYTKGLLCSVSTGVLTGIMSTYSGFQNFDISLGWINGWGNGFDNSKYGEGMVQGAFTYHLNKYASIKYAFLSGTSDISVPLGGLGPIAPATAKGNTTVHNTVLDLQLTSRLESVSLFYYGNFDSNSVYIWGEHLYYDLNCCAKLGFRAEWMKALIDGDDSELTTIGLGLNLHPEGIQNLYVRPEIRYDKSTNTDLLNGRADQFTIGFDVMLTF